MISRGARNHPITRGFICSKGKSFVERAYSPERLEANVSTRDPSAPVVPWSDGKFSTDSGKIELWSQSSRLRGEDPFPSYVPPHEGCCGESPFIDR